MLTCSSFIDTGVAAIPPQSAVLAAKEKRERMRAAGPSNSHADEYISLSLTTRDDEYQGPHPESRLMREDDDLGEGDDGELSNQPFSHFNRLAYQISPSIQVLKHELLWVRRLEKRRRISSVKKCKT